MERSLHGTARCALEWDFTARRHAADPFNDVELDVVVEREGGDRLRVPAFWAGGSEWRVRFAPPEPGRYRWRTECSMRDDGGLHGQSGTLEAAPYDGTNPLLRNGGIRVAANTRTFEHADGTPFIWLGDTWWMGLCSRWRWPDDFQTVCEDRARKGFTVAHLVAGLYPDMPAFDPRGANEAGYPWDKDWTRVDPAYFDMADLRIRWMIRSGIVPCVVGAWGYYLPWLGVEKMKRHWRYLVARWGAYPAFWCLAGEAIMPYYLSRDPEGERAAQKRGWTEIGRYVRSIDPYHHLVTLHTAFVNDSRAQVEDSSLVDFSLVQGGNSGYHAQEQTVTEIRAAVARTPRIPVVQGEACYEGNQSSNGPDIVRFCFWSTWLSGIGGYTYGADGIWQINSAEQPYGPSPHGMAWGDTPWQEALQAPGGRNVSAGKRVLEGLPWNELQPHQEWIEPAADETRRIGPYAAGIPRRLRIVYYPQFHLYPWTWKSRNIVKGLEADVRYAARFVDPRNGAEEPIGQVTPEADGTWRVPAPVTMHDWLLILEAS